MNYLLCISLVLFLCSCASTSNIIPADAGNFMITSITATMSPGSMKADLITKANTFCASKKQTMSIVELTALPVWPGHPGNAELIFHCNDK